MDPLTHVVVGRAVDRGASRRTPARPGRGGGGGARRAGARRRRLPSRSPAGTATCACHEIGTHSIAGAAIAARAAAAVVHLWGRTRRTDRGRTADRPRCGSWPLRLGGAMSHLALDVVSGARIRLWVADGRI